MKISFCQIGKCRFSAFFIVLSRGMQNCFLASIRYFCAFESYILKDLKLCKFQFVTIYALLLYKNHTIL